ncbi:replication-relaxation family protein [Aerococcaceae bacterium NML180378]|nr:replication-relaxation family protein [Aerococcaceae bacterium NML180378]
MNPQEVAILTLLAECRMATTHQIARLVFSDSISQRSSLRRANRTTRSLAQRQLIYALPRKIGGWTKGSASYVWRVTHRGLHELKKIHSHLSLKYRNRYYPTQHHVEHTLAVTELFVQLKELERQSHVTVLAFQFEPKSWRSYANRLAEIRHLKPDAYVVVALGEFEDSYFLELDRSSESLNRVVNTCKKYIHYYHSGIEQRERDIFPFVVWVVPDIKRQKAIQSAIDEALHQFQALFTVITLEEFQLFIQGGHLDENNTTIH